MTPYNEMLSLLPSVLLLLIGTVLSTSGSKYCPPNSEVSGCSCRHGNFYIVQGTFVRCEGITDPVQLKSFIQKFQDYEINLLEFSSLSIPFLPAGLFSGTWVQRMKITDSYIENIYSAKEYSPSPFDGLHESLEQLHVIRTRDPSKWLWPDMKNLKKLNRIEFMQSPINFVGHQFSEIGEGSVKSMTFSYSNVYRIHPQAFSDSKNLSGVELGSNSITYMSRTMFPNPAPKLSLISLRNNSLDILPEDMFENMPALVTLDLSKNSISTLPQKTYEPVVKQLQFFGIMGNPLVCDCKLRWLMDYVKDESYRPSMFLRFATCSSPPNLAGLELGALNPEQLIC